MYETGYGTSIRNGKMKRIKLVVNNLTGEGPFRNCEDVADKFTGHFGDVFLVISRLNAFNRILLFAYQPETSSRGGGRKMRVGKM